MTLTKNMIIDEIKEKVGFSRHDSAEIVEKFIEIIKKTLEDGEDVLISGFGKFCVKERKKRQGRNLSTGESYMKRKESYQQNSIIHSQMTI